MKNIFVPLFLIVSYLFSPVFSEYAPNVPLDSHRDAFLEQLSCKYSIPLPRNFFAQPMRADEIDRFCKAAESLSTQGVLSLHEKEELKRIQRSIGLEKPLLKYSKPNKDTRSQADLLMEGALSLSNNDSVAVFAKGIIKPRASGNVGKFSYYTGVDVWTDYRSDSVYLASNYQPFEGTPYNLYKRARSSNMRSSDLLTAGINYTTDALSLETSIDKLKYGPAVFMPLHFSGNAPPILYFRGILDLGPITYYHTFGQLSVQKDKEKFLYTHRANIPLLKYKIVIGLNESIVYGSSAELAQKDSLQVDRYNVTRKWSWLYMVPFVPYMFAQNYLGDRDNSIMSFDLSVQLPKKFRWYGEFFIDDMLNPWSFWTNDWGNKIAYTLGGRYFSSVAQTDFIASAEYAHVEPWVYTHFYGASHNFTHFSSPLGASIGPNADNTVLSIETFPLKTLSAGLSLTYSRKGISRGSSVYDVFQDTSYTINNITHKPQSPDSWTKSFLSPNPKSNLTIALFGRWNIHPAVWLDYSLFVQSGEKTGGGISGVGYAEF